MEGKYEARKDAKTKRLIGKAHANIKSALEAAEAALVYYDGEDEELILTGDLSNTVTLLKVAEGIIARHSG